jgi:hypothetical protein
LTRILRVYCDTSVFGGCFDEEFSEASLQLFDHFRHIVHFDKIRGYHGVNLLQGFGAIPIHSPPEVI